jgi:hypothetical protein
VGGLVVEVVAVRSLHPNHPGVWQVVVEVVVIEDEVDELVLVVVVVSSKQPHQPGVLHVDVRVLDEVELDEEEVELSVPLLSGNFQG